eukprot:932771-Pelagomonas_calceolata.AAC.8
MHIVEFGQICAWRLDFVCMSRLLPAKERIKGSASMEVLHSAECEPFPGKPLWRGPSSDA